MKQCKTCTLKTDKNYCKVHNYNVTDERAACDKYQGAKEKKPKEVINKLSTKA